MFYDIFSLLAARNGTSPTALAQSLGINKSNVSNWKNNGYMPRGAALNKIAEALNVTSDYLLTMSNYTFPTEWEPDCIEDWQNAKNDDEKRRMLSAFGICPAVMKEAERLLGLTKRPVTSSDGLTEQDKKDIAVELEQLMQEMQNSGDLMFDGEPATPEAMESLRQAMELGLTYAKKIKKGK